MASTIKSDFIQQFEKIKFDIQTKNYANIYFAYGKESYFIDQLQHTIENEILDPADKDFNLYILYGKDTTIPDIINIAESYSFLVITKSFLLERHKSLVLLISIYLRNIFKSLCLKLFYFCL